MQKKSSLETILMIIGIFATVTAIAAAVWYFFNKKKKDAEELERYLDCSIQ